MPASTYSLKLTADLTRTDGHFQDETNPRSRRWASRPPGSLIWTDSTINPDDPTQGPILKYRPRPVPDPDQLEFTVYFTQPASVVVSTVELYAIYTPKSHADLPVISPFRYDSGGVRSLFGGSIDDPTSGVIYHVDVANGVHAVILQAPQLSISDAAINSTNKKHWHFEFTLVARFRLSSPANSVLEFSYDPEMEVDVTTGAGGDS